jgi:hypothetical protein
MAVAPPPDVIHDALLEGELLITEKCVYLKDPDDLVFLLVFPADISEWLATDNAIGFTRPPSGTVTIHNGDLVSLGGSSPSPGEWVAEIDWIKEPDPSCSTDLGWRVGEVVLR